MSEPTQMQSPPFGTVGPNDPARRLSNLWRQGQRPRVEDFLAQAGISDPALVVTVLRADQWERRKLGQWVSAESYLEAYPAVSDEPEQAIDLVFAEFLLREQLGESPTLEEYVLRFPQYADQLKLQVELHRAVEEHGTCEWPATWYEGQTNPSANQRTESEARSESESEDHPNIPGYEVMGILGWGGMGVVYRAWQYRLNRMVALKMVHAGAHASPQVLARFRAEGEAVARLHHPNIVQIHEVGQHAGCPFLVLELVEGRNLAQWLAGTPQPARRAAELVETLARAVQSAHRQGVVHRDLTPTNILLAADGVPKITDFGLAKIVIGGNNLRTQTGELLGTPSYMAPEQAASRHQTIGPATDVYALGAILYEMLTGRPPFKAESPWETLRQVVADEPVSPYRLRPRLTRDLETICLKCLRKEPTQRYSSALALADDLRRFLDGRPIRARRSGALERAWLWCRRNPGLAAAITTAAAAVVTLAVVSTGMAWRFRDQRNQIAHQRDEITGQRDQIRQAETETRENLFKALTAQARSTRFSRQVGQRYGSLEALRQAAEIARSVYLPAERLSKLRDEAIACLTLPDLKPTGRVFHRPPGVALTTFDSTMTRVGLRFKDGTILVRRADDDQEVARFTARGDRYILVFVLSPDGRYLATTHYPGTALTVWDVDRRAIAVNDSGPVAGHAVRFSPDSRLIALVHEDGEVFVYDLSTGQPIRRWSFPGAQDLAFRPDGAQIAVFGVYEGASACRILDAETGELVRSIAVPAMANAVAWSSDGTMLATTCRDRKIYVWDAPTGVRRAILEGHINYGVLAAFHPAGTLLASTGWEDRLWLWDPILGRHVLTVTGTIAPQFSRDGRLALSSEDSLTEYRVDPALEYRTFAHVSAEPIQYLRAAIRHDGRVLAAGTSRGVALCDLARGTELGFLTIGPAVHLLFEASGDLLTSGSTGVQRWPIQLNFDRAEFRIGPPRQLKSFPSTLCGIAEDASGRVVALANRRAAYVMTPERAFRVAPLDDVRSVAVSPDGQWLVTGSHGHTGAEVWQVRDGARVEHLPIEGLVEVIFSPDGKWLMSQTAPCGLWAARTWREARRIGGDGLCFSPDGRLMAVQDARKAIRLVESETGLTLARLESPDLCEVRWATFSPDGSRLVVTTNDGPAVHVWDLRAIRRQLTAMKLDWDAPAYSDDDPCGPAAPPLPPLQVDYGRLAAHREHHTESPATLVDRYAARLKTNPDDADAFHHHAHALIQLSRLSDAREDLTRAIRLRPNDAHFRTMRGGLLVDLKQLEPAIVDLEAALAIDPDLLSVRELLARCYNNQSWELATGPEPRRDLDRALALSRRAVALTPGEAMPLNTLGVVQYRTGRYHEAVATLEQSLAGGRGQSDAFDLFFLAMAHYRLGHRPEARDCFDRAVRWLGEQKSLPEPQARELAAFRAEAKEVLGGTERELPDDVFAIPLG